jgi:short subunit dehydrogenase-like uncharacterized protein
MLYGAYGYTGRLLVEEALRRGHRPLLAGRSAEKLQAMAAQSGLKYVAFDLQEATTVLRLRKPSLVLHAAGPFIDTSAPRVAACLDIGAHYLDITGEIAVFEQTYAQDDPARQRGIALISGVGFDIVPSDCLIHDLLKQVEQPDDVEVAIDGLGVSRGEGMGASAGTLKTSLEMIVQGIVARRDGRWVPLKLGAGTRRFRFPHGERVGIPIPWGDLSATYHAARVPNITAYLMVSGIQAQLVRALGSLIEPPLHAKIIRRGLGWLIERSITGPSERVRETGRTQLYAKITNRVGQSAEAWLETVEAYRFTAQAGIRAVEQVLNHPLRGALTPAQAFGADFVFSVGNTTRRDTLSSCIQHRIRLTQP